MIIFIFWINIQIYCYYCFFVKVFIYILYFCFFLFYFFDFVCLFFCQFDGCFDCFGVCVYGQDYFVFKYVFDFFGLLGKDVVVEGVGGEGEVGGLVGEGFDEGGVVVILVDGVVGGEEVEVVVFFGVLDVVV